MNRNDNAQYRSTEHTFNSYERHPLFFKAYQRLCILTLEYMLERYLEKSCETNGASVHRYSQ